MKNNSLSGRLFLLVLAVISLLAPSVRAQNNGPVNAVALNGTSGYITVPNAAWFTGNFTVESWVYVESYNAWSRLIDFGNGQGNDNIYLALTAGTTGTPNLGIYTNNGTGSQITSSVTLPLNQWAHLACTLSGTTGSIYINGALVASGTLQVPHNITRTNCYIGRSGWAADSYADAIFDDTRIWNYARTQAQITSGMHQSLVGNETGLLGYWRYDESSGTTAADVSGHSETATFNGGVTRTVSTAPVSSGDWAVNFVSTNGQTVTIPHKSYQNSYPFTVMAWFKEPTTGSGGALVNKYTSGSGSGWQIAFGGQLRAWYFINSSSNLYNNGVMGAGSVNDGLWHHAAMTVDATGGRLFLDGVQRSTCAWAGTPGSSTNTNSMYLGLYPGDSFTDGAVDEVSLWNVALTTNQIQTYMHAGLVGTESGLVAYYPLNEGTNTTVTDLTTNANNGVSSGGATWVLSGANLGAPRVVTLPSNSVSASSATLNASVNPEGQSATVYFLYGSTTNYGSQSGTASAGTGFATVTNSVTITGLAAGTYHYEAVAYNLGDTNYGVDQTFATGGSPSVSNFASSNITGTTATLGATVNPNALATTAYFVYGPTTAYGFTNTVSAGSGSSTNLTASLTGLTPASLYHCNVIVSNSSGTASAGDATFSTVAGAPVVTTLAATNIGSTTAYLNASVNPGGGSTIVYFAYGTTTNYGATNTAGSAGSGTSAVNISGYVTGLAAGTLYHYQAFASNSSGVVKGADTTFTTLAIFTSVSAGISPTADYASSFAWGDFNNDDSLDLITETTVYKNNGSGSFSTVSTSFPSRLYFSTATWFDYDNDGYLDLLICGENQSNVPTTQLWHNNGNGTFTQVANPGLPNVYEAIVGVGDFDNDGHQDLIFCGYTGNYNGQGDIDAGGLYHNNGDGTFTQISVPGFAPMESGSVGVGDFDNDGYLDFIISGRPGTGQNTQLWHNNGNGTFSQVTVTNVLVGFNSSIAVGDFNNDGRLDFAICADSYSTGTYVTEVWSNGGNMTFTLDSQTTFPGVDQGALAWGDFDNDGQLDLIVEGATSSSSVDQLWQNQGNGNFANTGLSLPSLYYGTAAWGDYNNDGRLDFIVGDSTHAQLEKNLTAISNTPPTAPTGLQSVISNRNAILIWNAATDAQTPSAGLYYNVRVGTNSGGINTVAPASDVATGYRRLPNFGNAQETRKMVLTNLAFGVTYYWSVQAIDTGLAGSPFATEGQFILIAPPTTTTQPATSVAGTSATLNGIVNAQGNATTAWFQWGATTNYGFTNGLFNAGNGTTNISVSTTLSNLTLGATYHFTLAASNNIGGSNAGVDMTFTIPVIVPAIANVAVSNVSFSTASIGATVTPDGADTLVYIVYGTDATYGTTNLISDIGNGSNAVSVSTSLSGLTPGIIYHYQILATNSAGVSTTADGTFQTYLLLPVVTALPVGNIDTNVGTLNGLVNPNGSATEVYFYYGPTTAYGTTNDLGIIGSDSNTYSVSSVASNLVPSTTYHFLLVASNAVGITNLGDATFRTLGSPLAITLPASGVRAVSAMLNASVNPEGFDTTVYFQYGSTTNYGSVTAATIVYANTTPSTVALSAGRLSPLSTYHFQVVASNSFGSVTGGDLTFTTGTYVGTNVVTLAYDTAAAGGLRQAIINANAATGDTVVDASGINGDIVLTNMLPIITSGMIIQGPGAGSLTVDGQGLYRVFLVDAAGEGVVISNLTIANGLAQGGAGGNRGGGGAGLGAGLLVNAGDMTVAGVRFSNNVAVGGTGGPVVNVREAGGGGGLGGNGGTGNNSGAGGGGGFGGAGGNGYAGAAGGGGLIGPGGDGAASYGGGGGGGGLTAGSTGVTTSSTSGGGAGGIDGGNGGYFYGNGSGGSFYGGGGGAGSQGYSGGNGGSYGGGGGGTETSYGAPGGQGGEFGGGGGAGGFNNGATGGTGGFGAGGGGGGQYGGPGGFGGGGGGNIYNQGGTSLAFGGTGGNLNNSYYGGGGGGGAALGAAIFVRADNGATFIFVDSSTDHGTVSAGQPGLGTAVGSRGDVNATAGAATGSALFLLSGTNYLRATHGTNVIAGDIAGWGNEPSVLIKDGAGAVLLSSSNYYPGATCVNGGALLVNGLISGPVTINGGGNLGGLGSVGDLTVNSGGTVSGGGVGTFTVGNATWLGAGHYNWQMQDALGAAGSGYDLLHVTGTLDVSGASGFVINISSAGLATNFNSGGAYSWTIAQADGGIVGFSPANFSCNALGLANPLNGGTFNLAVSNNYLVLNFQPSLLAVTTLPAQPVTLNQAVLNGSVNPGGLATAAWFQYGSTTNYGGVTATNLIGGGTNAVTVSNLISGLTAGTTGHFRMVATNASGSAMGNDLSFVTLTSFSITSVSPKAGPAVLLQFSGTVGAGYTLQSSTNLSAWSYVTRLTADTNGLFQYTAGISNNYPAIYFRLVVP